MVAHKHGYGTRIHWTSAKNQQRAGVVVGLCPAGTSFLDAVVRARRGNKVKRSATMTSFDVDPRDRYVVEGRQDGRVVYYAPAIRKIDDGVLEPGPPPGPGRRAAMPEPASASGLCQCGERQVIPEVGLCAVCTLGEADAAEGTWQCGP